MLFVVLLVVDLLTLVVLLVIDLLTLLLGEMAVVGLPLLMYLLVDLRLVVLQVLCLMGG
jgi:hypothetical protein